MLLSVLTKPSLPQTLIAWNIQYLSLCEQFVDYHAKTVTCGHVHVSQLGVFHLFTDKAYQVKEVSWEGHAVRMCEVRNMLERLFQKS